MKALFTKTLAVLLSAMLLFTAVPFAASAATTAEQSTGASSGTTGSCTWTLDDEGTLTISGNGAMENYYYDPTLPWGKNITNVVIENGVTSIGSYAFYKCTGLTSVTIPDSVTSIGSSAFYNTAWYNNQPDGLVYAGKVAYKYKGTMPDNTSIVLKDGTKGIADSAFSGCTGLTSVTIPDSVTSIEYRAFRGCTGLTSVTIPDSVTSIGNSAFSGCTGLTSVTIENSVTSIGNHAFEDCTGLKGVYLTDLAAWCNIKFADSTSNPLYYAHKLYLNNQLVTDLEIPDSVTSIGGSTFKNCTELKEITIPDSVTSIESSAFSGCTGLTSVTIPDSVTSIGEDAFYGCTALANITIPDSVTSIGECAFYGCTGLTIFGSSGSYAISYAKNYNIIYQPLDGTSGVCTWTLDDEGTLTISGNGAMANYYSSSTLPWGRNITNVVIENGVTSIGSYAFHNCTGLTSVTIPDSVTSIEKSAFYRCTGLESITIGNSVTSIGSYAFYGCTGLTSVTIGNGVTSIEKSAFSGCKGLTSISVPDSVVYIGDNALSNCSEDLVITCFSGTAAEDFAKRYGIQTDIIPFAVNKLENKTFEITGYTGNSKDVVIPDKILDKDVTSISKWAFANNTKIESVVIPDSITAIAKGAFYNCTELKTVTMGGNVTEIGANAFEKCLYLEEINLSDKLTTIGDAAFYDCRKLKQLDIPETVTSFGDKVFTNCYSLTNLVIPDGVEKLGDESAADFGIFENCKSLKEITIPDSVGEIQSNAFDGCDQVTIIGTRNSYAKSYANANNISFKAINSDAVGDMDGDGIINGKDAALLARYTSGWDGYADKVNLDAADINGDGKVNGMDSAILMRYTSGWDGYDHYFI